MVNVAAIYTAPRGARCTPWVDRLRGGAAPGDAGAYVSFLGDEGEARVREAYRGPTWDRLAAIKARYDPTNLFRLNQNNPPAPGSVIALGWTPRPGRGSAAPARCAVHWSPHFARCTISITV